MRTIAHLSDLHFGRVDPPVVEALAGTIVELGPDIVAISGDLTQRARTPQFRLARAFLDRLPQPQIVVPGNHDVPLYNVVARVCTPLRRFQRHVTADLRPRHADADLLVLGVDTTQAWSKDGGIRPRDVQRILDAAATAAPNSVKVVVCHHPVDRTVETLARGGVDLFLTGHLHVSSSTHTAERFAGAGFSSIVVGGGTATSTRMRGEGNAFNVLRIEPDRILVERFEWQPGPGAFSVVDCQRFARTPLGWFPL